MPTSIWGWVLFVGLFTPCVLIIRASWRSLAGVGWVVVPLDNLYGALRQGLDAYAAATGGRLEVYLLHVDPRQNSVQAEHRRRTVKIGIAYRRGTAWSVWSRRAGGVLVPENDVARAIVRRIPAPANQQDPAVAPSN